MKYLGIPIFFSFLIPFLAQAQNKPADNYRIKLEAFRAMHPPAMVYFHFDKAAYSAGDTMRFKGYQVENEDWKPRNNPQFIDIEITNIADNQSITKQQVVLDNGIAIGTFFLPMDLKAGIYRFKADSYLMNFDAPEIDFVHEFKVLGVQPITKPKAAFSAACFSEDGNLVQGILSKIIVKASEDGAGKIVNEKGDSLANFTVQGGFSSFKYRPKNTDKLYIVLKDKRLALPEVQKTGICMSIDNTGDVTIVVAAKMPEGEYEKRVTVMTENNGKTAQYFDLIAVNGKTIQVFPKYAVKPGITRISLLDANTNIISQRLIYNHAPNLMSLSCDKKVKDLGKELEITLTIDAINPQGKPIDGNLSISIIDSLNYVENIDNQDIITSLMLQQNLATPVENLSNYFSNNRLSDASKMENLMLSQKYARYDWNEVKNYQYKVLDAYRVPYADERRAEKPRSFVAKNGLYYWNPELVLQNGKGTITFKVPKSAKIHYTICGFDKNGSVGNLNF
jgi:hypothetical protein